MSLDFGKKHAKTPRAGYYIACLMNVEELQFADEIDCKDLFPGENQRERIVIFELGEIAG